MKKGRQSVITISYVAEELNFSKEQAQTMCKAAQQLSAVGVTIVVSVVYDYCFGE